MGVDTSGLAQAQWAVGRYQMELPASLGAANLKAAEALKKAMQASYKKATVSSLPNTWATIANKNLKPEFWGGSSFQVLARQGIINTHPLVETGSLGQAVDDIDVTAFSNGGDVGAVMALNLPRAGSDCHFPFQERRDKEFVYAWVHEFGAGPTRAMYKFGWAEWGHFAIPKRPWIERGMKEGMAAARTIVATAAAKAQADFQGRVGSRGGRGFLNFNMGSLFWDLVSIAMPPTNLYAYWGAMNDYLSMMQGNFTVGSFGTWVNHYAMGSVGISRNVYRRKLRNALYH
jgi:hypothetical protein